VIWNILFYFLASVFIISIIYRAFAKEKGVVLRESQDKNLFQLVTSVSQDLGVRMPDKIILTPYSSIGVGGLFRRTLSIGVATLNSLTTLELYSILFHEFAHYRGRDNIIGSTLMRLTYAFRDTVSVAGHIPTIFGLILWIPLALFYYMFAAATLLYSRQREYLADWFAAYFVGGKVFGNALDRYVKASHLFDIQAKPIMQYHLSRRRIPINIYEETNTLIVDFDDQTKHKIENDLREIYEKTSLLSTHPATKIRIEKLGNMEGILKSLPAGYCSDLFDNFKNYEEQLTRMLFLK